MSEWDKEKIQAEALADILSSTGAPTHSSRISQLALIKYPWLFNNAEEVEMVLERYFSEVRDGVYV